VRTRRLWTRDKLVGTWRITKSQGKATTEYGVLDFTKDDKLKIITKARVFTKGDKKEEIKNHIMEVTYEVKGNQLNLIAKIEDKEHTRTVTIKTLTEKKLVTVDLDGKEDEFEKTK
jgi:uncharacterized protein (TIGR03066 family)